MTNLLAKKSYASITAGLSTMVSSLEGYIVEQENWIKNDQARMKAIEESIANRQDEISKSTQTVKNIRGLIVMD
jgi:hypothetical protein